MKVILVLVPMVARPKIRRSDVIAKIFLAIYWNRKSKFKDVIAFLSVFCHPERIYVITTDQSGVFLKIAEQYNHALKLDWKKLSLEEAHDVFS